MQIKAYAKVNIFLKIVGHKDGYHQLVSRMMKVENLYDTISFVPCKCDNFTIEGVDIPLEENIIYKAYKSLNEYTGDLDILEFFYNHKVVIDKKIPTQAGLGGGSSNAGAFIRLVKEVCNLVTPIEELAQIGSKLGADIPFFIYNYPSANISGFGEVVTPFNEELLNIKTYTPKIGCNTALVYKTFKENFLEKIEKKNYNIWLNTPSKELLENHSIDELNDLFKASKKAYPNLKEKKGYYFSGSGSSFFTYSKEY